ncbi:MAG: hypothetical protein ACYTG6_12725, partial [Planctomycetota bacterium]
QQPSGSLTVQDILAYPPQIIAAILSELGANKREDATVITQLQQDNTAKAEEITRVQQELSDEQDRHTQDVDNLRAELTTANDNLTRARQEATTAQQRAAVLEDEKERGFRERDQLIAAQQERILTDKEVRDLAIRRDDVDGTVLAASPTMGTAIINLGSADKVFPGLKFRVSYMGRGGQRLTKGEVMVLRVTGPHSSTVSILAELDPANPIGRSDMLSNPFYSPTEEIHIWIAGELSRYPLSVARTRLEKMGVIIDGELNGNTDYVVIPDSMAAPVPTDDEDMDEENGAAVQSEYEQIEKLARDFGATVITESMLDNFLGY